MTFDVLWLVAAFGGGVAGAAFGALPIFILLGIMVVGGVAVSAATGNAQFSNVVAWGPLWGPQVSFASGCAAAAYAASKGKLSSGRDIVSGLAGLDSWDVLLVGGVFGSLGYVFQWILANIKIGEYGITNPIACSICVSAIIIRLLWSKKGILGQVRPGDNRWRPSDVAAWIPWQARPVQLLVLAASVSLVASYMVNQFPALVTVTFGILVFALIFIQYGTKIPIMHHVALAAEFGTIASGGNIWWGVTLGLIGAFAGEFGTALLMNHADTHFDPPSISLTISMTVQNVLLYFGVIQAIQGTSALIVAVIVGAALTVGWAALQGRPNAAVPAKAAPAR